MKNKNEIHKCRNSKKGEYIYKLSKDNGYKDLNNKWVLDALGIHETNRTFVIIQYCPFCGLKLL